MPLTDDLRKDMYLLIDGKINYVADRKYKTQGRQGGLIILSLRNLSNGNIHSVTVKAGTKFDQIEPETKEVQFLYSDGDKCFFMDMESFETLEVDSSVIGDYKNFMKEGDRSVVMMFDGKVISIRRNLSVALKVTESVDAVRGNTANAATKTVTVETGYRVNVPLFVKLGDTITINTESGEYTGRV
jgi:elongation factor P